MNQESWGRWLSLPHGWIWHLARLIEENLAPDVYPAWLTWHLTWMCKDLSLQTLFLWFSPPSFFSSPFTSIFRFLSHSCRILPETKTFWTSYDTILVGGFCIARLLEHPTIILPLLPIRRDGGLGGSGWWHRPASSSSASSPFSSRPRAAFVKLLFGAFRNTLWGVEAYIWHPHRGW